MSYQTQIPLIFVIFFYQILYMVHLDRGPFSGSLKHSGNIGLLKSKPKHVLLVVNLNDKTMLVSQNSSIKILKNCIT